MKTLRLRKKKKDQQYGNGYKLYYYFTFSCRGHIPLSHSNRALFLNAPVVPPWSLWIAAIVTASLTISIIPTQEKHTPKEIIRYRYLHLKKNCSYSEVIRIYTGGALFAFQKILLGRLTGHLVKTCVLGLGYHGIQERCCLSRLIFLSCRCK